MRSAIHINRRTGHKSRKLGSEKQACTSSFPVLDSQGHGIAAITVPYAERIDQSQRKTVPEVQASLGIAARELSSRVGGSVNAPKLVAGGAKR